jgi:hypothetical protein
VADDPGSKPAPRSRRRRRAGAEAGSDVSSAASNDAPQPVEPAPTPDPIDDRPFPTFLHAGPGIDGLADALSDTDRGSEAVTAESRYAADRILDGWAENLAAPALPALPAPLAPPTPSPVDQGWLPMLEDRSPDPEICPFLRAADDGDRLVAPVETPDPANRCAALRDAVPQSLRQQELVCLSSGHVNCPRYLRGAVVIVEAPEPAVRRGRALSPAVLGSLLVLVMAASASVAFVMARGGLELAAAAPTSSPARSLTAVAQASATPVATIAPTPLPTPAPTPAPTASPSPTPAPTPSPTASPSPTPTPTPTPTAKPTPRPATGSASRYAVLRACPDTPRCWIYRVRAGDNLYSIAHWFGISLDSIYARNPWTRTQGLRAGQELRLPPPTR